MRGGFLEAVDEVVELEKIGVDIALVAEAYSYDAISQLGFLAAKTSRIELGTGVVPDLHPHPVAAGDDGRGTGLRVRRPVPAGHRHVGPAGDGGLPRRAVRRAARPHPRGRRDLPAGVAPRDGCTYDGKYYQIPLPADRGTGLGKPLQLINHPVRERIPITIAALGPKNVELTAEIAEGWQPVFFYPEKADDGVGRGAAGRVSPSAIRRWARSTSWSAPRWPSATTSTTDWLGRNRNWRCTSAAWAPAAELLPQPGDPLRVRRGGRPHPGPLPRGQEGRGHRGGARRAGAATFRWSGPRGFVKERVAAYAEAGVTTLLLQPLSGDRRESVRFVEELQGLLP